MYLKVLNTELVIVFFSLWRFTRSSRKLPEFVAEWEKGYKCIIGQKVKTEEGWLITRFRKLYYNMIDILGEKSKFSL